MAGNSERPYVDAQSLTGADTDIYEAIATLEQKGRPVTQGELAAALHLDEGDIAEKIQDLTRRGLIAHAESAGEPAFQPARRDWSSDPTHTGP